MSFVKSGSPKEAKYAIRCIDTMCRSKDVIFKQLFEVALTDVLCLPCMLTSVQNKPKIY